MVARKTKLMLRAGMLDNTLWPLGRELEIKFSH